MITPSNLILSRSLFSFGIVILVLNKSWLLDGSSNTQQNSELLHVNPLFHCLYEKSPTIKLLQYQISSMYNDSRVGNNRRYDSFYPIVIINVTSVRDISAGAYTLLSLVLN